MFKKSKADSVKTYLAAIPEERKEEILFLHDFIQKTSPNLKPHFAYNMLGYGSFLWRNYKGEQIAWPTIALANQKNYISLYVSATDNGEYLAEKNKEKLGKVNVGKSCIRFKKLKDLNLHALKSVIKKAAKNPGLILTEKDTKKK